MTRIEFYATDPLDEDAEAERLGEWTTEDGLRDDSDGYLEDAVFGGFGQDAGGEERSHGFRPPEPDEETLLARFDGPYIYAISVPAEPRDPPESERDLQNPGPVPDNAESIQDPSEAPEGAAIVQGPRGGLYYIAPGGGESADATPDADVPVGMPEGGLGPGDQFRFSADGPAYTVEKTAEDRHGTVIFFTDDDGEPSFVYADLLAGAEEDGGTEGEGRVKELLDAGGVNASVSLDGLDDAQQSAVRAGFDRVWSDAFAGQLPVLQVTTDAADDADFTDAHAAYRGRDRLLYINPDTFEAEGEPQRGDILLGVGEWAVVHELGHAAHYVAGFQNFGSLADTPVRADLEQQIRREVSMYATYNAHEFVAETFVGLHAGFGFSEDIMDYYRELGGPEVGR